MKTPFHILFHIFLTVAFGFACASGVAALAFEMNLAGDLMICAAVIGFLAMLIPDDLPRD